MELSQQVSKDPASTSEALSDCRETINALDQEILSLLNRRAAVSLAIAGIKRQIAMPIFDEGRERAVIERLEDLNEGPLQPSQVANIYSSIFQSSRDLQAVAISENPPQ